jgi:hypothetical protein
MKKRRRDHAHYNDPNKASTVIGELMPPPLLTGAAWKGEALDVMSKVLSIAGATEEEDIDMEGEFDVSDLIIDNPLQTILNSVNKLEGEWKDSKVSASGISKMNSKRAFFTPLCLF